MVATKAAQAGSAVMRDNRKALGIAIVGMACRFPGASDWRTFWRNLCGGVEAVTMLSDAELMAAGVEPARIRDPDYVKAAFPLPGADEFDAGFFGYSPHEARLIDPQQRHLLEVAWEAFEDAGYPPGQDHGPVGVYASTGSVVTNYMMNELSDHPDARGATASLLHIGNDKDFAGTRVSFKLNLTGPSLNVQTACSTSLVLVDLACRAIRDGDCAMALAAAGNVRVPQMAGYMNVKGAVFSPDGHIRTFDAEAGGTVFSNGVAAVLFKDLDRALQDGDHIYAVIRGTAVNNDGARKASYAGTSVRGQTEVMAGAVAQAGFDLASVGYVECHGTGTTIGDPREFTAVMRALGGAERSGKCPIGSAKPNIGHSEQSAGLASLIKTALALDEGLIPPTINFRTPNPRLKLESSPFFVNTELRPWPSPDRPRRAVVNALGIGGTNAAVALEQAPPVAADGLPERPLHLFVLSGKTAAGLEQTAQRQLARLADASLGDICHTLAAGRTHFPHRFAAVAETSAGLAAQLAEFKADPKAARRSNTPRRIGFLYSGQGAQFAGMGRRLYETEPVFRAALDRVAGAMADHLDRSLIDVLFAGGDAIDHTRYTQPALFAVQVALAEMLGQWGIRPDAVAGHSIGEFAAAHLAGVYSLEQAARLVCERGRLMGALPAGGAMAAVFADEATVAGAIAALSTASIGIAAVNGPQGTVVSGEAAAVAEVLARLERQGVAAKGLTVSHAFHSPLMAPALDGLRAAAEAAVATAPAITWISTLTGRPMTEAPTAGYWCDQARQAVRFADAVRQLAQLGITDFVEIGPGASLLALGQGSAGGEGLAWLPSLGKAGGDECRSVLEAVAGLYRRGHDVDWAVFDAPFRHHRLSLPTYAFQHERVWAVKDYQPAGPSRAAAPMAGLAGTRLRSPLAALQFETRYSRAALDWLDDHRIHGAVVLPTTAGLVAALEGARQALGDGPLEIADFSHGEALVLDDDEERLGHLVIEPRDGSAAAFTLASLGEGEGAEWRTHMRGAVRRVVADMGGGFDPKPVKRRCGLPVKADSYYAGARSLGLGYGPAFRGIESLWRGEGEALARVRLPDAVNDLGNGIAHPALLDACLHVYPAVIDAHGDFTRPPPAGAVAYLPLGLERFRAVVSDAREVWVHARRRKANGGAEHSTIDIDAFDGEGRRVIAFEGLAVKPMSPTTFRPAKAGQGDGWLYRLRWDERPLAAAGKDASPLTWLLLGGDGVAPALELALKARGAACRRVSAAEIPPSAEAFAALLDSFAAEAGAGRAGIVHLCGLDGGGEEAWGDEATQRRIYGSALDLARALAVRRTGFLVAPKLWLVTRNAVAATGREKPADVLAAGLWGFGRSLALEAPAVWAGLVDLEAGASPADEAPLLAAQLAVPFGGDDGEGQVALRGGRRLAARLVRSPLPPRRPMPTEGGSYLITGGLGALGVEVAEWLIRHRKAHTLVLASRQGAKAANAEAVTQRLEALGAKVVIAKADIAEEGDVRRLMQRLRKVTPALRGIYHSAGVVDDGLAEQMEWPRFRRALAPKLDAAWWLHRHSRDLALDDFVMFSSVLSVIGSAGQTNYTTGNACLDALAVHRRRQGLPGLAVNWGPWADAGLASQLGEQGEAIWRARGMHYIAPELGRQAFDALFDGDLDHGVVAVADWPAFLRQFAMPPRLYAELQGGASGGLAADIEALRARLAAPDPVGRRAALTDFLARQVMTTLGMAQPVEADRPLRELGLDSLMSVTLINRVESATGVRIPAVKLIKGPSIAELVDEVWPDLAGAQAPGPAAAAEAEPPPKPQATREGTWLVPVVSRPSPRFRLFCFPFAGGGSAAFQAWGAAMDPAIEVIAVEPPGRLARIAEKPVRDMDTFVEAVLDEMEDRLDLPFGLFGHCLGGLTLYEVARTLVRHTSHRPRHLFCSGARSPDRVRVIGGFEKSLAMHLAKLPGYQPRLPPYRQPDDVFAEIIRHFDMAASDQFLDDPELRRLMLPAVRAEFEMTSRYRYRPERPWDIPITCFVSKGDPYVSRQDVLGWGRFTNSRMQVHMREGSHYSIFEDAAFIQRTISRELTAPPS